MMPKSTRSPGSALRERTRLILDWDKILVDYVTQVMELEQRLEEVEEKIDIKPQVNPAMAPWTTCGYMSNRKTSTAHNSELFPDDLAGVDVSAFKHLICSQPLRIDASLFQ
nr:unnamed protein product [Haemonchus contortus]